MAESPRRILWRETLLGILVLSIGLATAGFVAINLASDLSIWVLGRRVEGQVVDQWVERIGDQEEGELSFRYLIRYQFTTPRGRTISKDTTLSVLEWSNLKEGGPIDVVYFPLYPDHARPADQRFVSIYACAYIPFAVVAWAGLRVGLYLFGHGIGKPVGRPLRFKL
jgi:hypothetical protein